MRYRSVVVGFMVGLALLGVALERVASAGDLPEPWPVPGGAGPGIHALELARHEHVVHVPLVEPGQAPMPMADARPVVDRVVYGYFPYWASGFGEIQWDLLTHVSYFAVSMDGDGDLTNYHGWPDPVFVETAHEHGVVVELAVTLFDGGGILRVCSDPTARANAIDNLVTAALDGGADGVSIDFEGMRSGTRDHFSLFMEELRREFTERGRPDASISIAAPTSNWHDNFDMDRLMEVIDVFFVMGYNYHYGRSQFAGPVGQLRIGPLWRPTMSLSMLGSIAHWTSQIPERHRRKIIWGVPYYGFDWHTEGAAVPSPVVSLDDTVFYYEVADRLDRGDGERLWEPESMNPWVRYVTHGEEHQVWYDDAESLLAKYDLVRRQGLGVGMWALGYDVGRGELWGALRTSFAQDRSPEPGSYGAPIPITSFPFRDHRDTTEAPASHGNYYSCAPQTPEYGPEWVYRLSICQPGTLRAEVSDPPEVDIDLQLLSAPDQEHCLLRHDRVIQVALVPGTYWLVADTYVADRIPRAGPFDLSVDFTPDPGSEACGPGEVCEDGRCVAEGGGDAGVGPEPDAGPADAGSPDLGDGDLGAGGEDVGAWDSGWPWPRDTGVRRDSGGGAWDAGPADAGAPWGGGLDPSHKLWSEAGCATVPPQAGSIPRGAWLPMVALLVTLLGGVRREG